MRTRQRGVGLLMAVLLVVTVAAFAVLVAASQSGGDIQATDANADSLQALYLAETGIERALKRFANGTAACNALAETITDLSTIGLGTTAYSITVSNGVATDFAGAALLPNTQCRIAVTARVIASNVTRTVQAIVDRNLLEGADNPNFDNPLTAGLTPSGWTAINPANAFAANGGPDGTAPNCRRSAWTARDNPGAAANDRRATASAPVQITFTGAPAATTVWVHQRLLRRTADCAAALPGVGPAAAAWPAMCGASGNETTVCIRMLGTGGAGDWAAVWNADPTINTAAVACPSTYNPCQTNYQAGAPGTKLSLSVPMAGATSITQIQYWLRLQNAGRKELFLDGIEAINPTAVGAAYVKAWRDCSTVANPVTCV